MVHGLLDHWRKAWKIWVAAIVLVLVVVAGVGVYYGVRDARNREVHAWFPSATGLYAGDPVRILGVNVGSVASIDPRPDGVRVTLRVNRDVDIPAGADALIVAPTLVSGRFVALTPAYDTGAKMPAGYDIPMSRTAVPVEWDEIKDQLTRLSEAVGPGSDPAKSGQGALGRAAGVAADNLDGNGAALHDSITELSSATSTLADSRDDIFATVRGLQKLTDALSSSHDQLVSLNGRLASVSQVLGDNSDSLDAALRNLDEATGDITAFIGRNGSTLSESIGRLSDATKTLADKDEQVRGILHSSPTLLTNFYNIYNPLTGSLSGIFGLGMGGNLIDMLCGTMAGNARPENTDADIEHCVDVLTPVLSSIAVNYPPFLSNPVTGINARPDQIQYQNADVAARAKAGVRERDAATRSQYSNPALGALLVPFGGQG
ncbi:MCE family protein [Gordonia jinhuaensis]|uniref:Mammalian cell entry protein n=1 Tax=Gordonia jinhuaensis TaxID=1517702 RepID=A0A916THP8_9ACTN|nr:MCE family protein [Gordonia jinhuaensis]GGB45444.1 mammalian cell entry protein [Gordonia jinhuaensis]